MKEFKTFFIELSAFAGRNFIFAKRNVYVFVEMLFWPVIGVLSIGLMGSFLSLEENTLNFVLTGAIASGVLQVTQLDVGYSLLYDVWSKSVKHTFLTPARISTALLGAWIIGMIRGFAIFVVLAFLAKIFFGFRLPGFLPAASFLMGVFWMSFVTGLTVWILILRYGQRAEISVWALSYLVMILCGIYYPVYLLPEPFFSVARAIPLTYFLEGIRAHYGFQPIFSHGFWLGWLLNGVYMFGGLKLVQMSVEKARKSGLLLKLSE